MKLRWYQTYDENGVNSAVELQFYNEDISDWETVPFVREREVNTEE